MAASNRGSLGSEMLMLRRTPESRRLPASELVFAPDQIGHWLYIFRVTGEPEAPKMPCILNGCEHGEMVECIPGSACAMNVMGIYKRDHMSTARVGVTAPAGVAKARGTRTGEIAFVPHDENHRVSAPCLGIHNGADSLRQEQVSGCNQRLNLGEVT